MSRASRTGSPTLDRVAQVFRDKLNVEVSSVDTDLFESAALDSLAFVNHLVYLEQAFEVTVSLDGLELDDFRSLARIAELVDAHLASSGAGGVAAAARRAV